MWRWSVWRVSIWQTLWSGASSWIIWSRWKCRFCGFCGFESCAIWCSWKHKKLNPIPSNLWLVNDRILSEADFHIFPSRPKVIRWMLATKRPFLVAGGSWEMFRNRVQQGIVLLISDGFWFTDGFWWVLPAKLQAKQSATESVEQDASEGSSAPWCFADSCCRLFGLLEDLNIFLPQYAGIFRRLHPELSQVDRRHGRGWGKASRMAKAETLKSTGCFYAESQGCTAIARFH